nr:hypothetical protein [uncultured Bilophila sp.]
MSQLFRGSIQAADEALIEQNARKLGHADAGLFPAEGSLEGRISDEACFLARGAGNHGIQATAQRVVALGQCGRNILPYAFLNMREKSGKI